MLLDALELLDVARLSGKAGKSFGYFVESVTGLGRESRSPRVGVYGYDPASSSSSLGKHGRKTFDGHRHGGPDRSGTGVAGRPQALHSVIILVQNDRARLEWAEYGPLASELLGTLRELKLTDR